MATRRGRHHGDAARLAPPAFDRLVNGDRGLLQPWHGDSDGPWKTMETDRGVPYYVQRGSGASGQIHWFHPAMQGALGDLEQLNVIRYAVYRTAAKLLALQKFCCLHLVSVSTILTVFNSSAVDWESELNVRQVYQLLRQVHGMASREQPLPHVDGELASELTLNLLLAICDSEQSGQVSPRSMWNALLLLSTGQLTHKYRALYWAMLHNHQGKRDVAAGVSKSAVRTFLQDTTQLLALLGEGCAFGTAEMAVTSLFHAESVGSITESQFLGWCLSEPQLFLWLPAMYRMMKAAGSIHEAKCNICKTCPIVGLRFCCLRCWNLDLCQNCFLTGRDTGWHAPSHPVMESCTSGGVWSDVRLCLRKVRNIVLGERCRTKEAWRRGRLCPSSPLSAGPSQSVATGEVAVAPSHGHCMDPSAGSPYRVAGGLPLKRHGSEPLQQQAHPVSAEVLAKVELQEGRREMSPRPRPTQERTRQRPVLGHNAHHKAKGVITCHSALQTGHASKGKQCLAVAARESVVFSAVVARSGEDTLVHPTSVVPATSRHCPSETGSHQQQAHACSALHGYSIEPHKSERCGSHKRLGSKRRDLNTDKRQSPRKQLMSSPQQIVPSERDLFVEKPNPGGSWECCTQERSAEQQSRGSFHEVEELIAKLEDALVLKATSGCSMARRQFLLAATNMETTFSQLVDTMACQTGPECTYAA
ncbi:unnamed protein product [Lampetra planeri]